MTAVRSIVQLSAPTAFIWPLHGMIMSYTCTTLAIWNEESCIILNIITQTVKSPASKGLASSRLNGSRVSTDEVWASSLVEMTVG